MVSALAIPLYGLGSIPELKGIGRQSLLAIILLREVCFLSFSTTVTLSFIKTLICFHWVDFVDSPIVRALVLGSMTLRLQ